MGASVEQRRVGLRDGRETTIHVVVHRLERTRLRMVRLAPEAPLEEWCEREGVRDAVSGGFAVKPEQEPLGELWLDGRPAPHRPFADPWHTSRSAVEAVNGRVEIGPRDTLSARPDGGLLQAGPLLVRDGRSAVEGVDDPEGFSSTCEEFDQDITAEREPRLAIALTADAALGVAADGRGPDDAGMTLDEFAALLVDLGARTALNLDGGSAASLIADGRRLNTPRTDEGEPMDASSPAVSAIVFGRR